MTKLGLSGWANVAEIGAATGVMISLIFVGLELRSNTEATEAATREAVLQVGIEYLSLRVDSAVLARAHAKGRNGEELSPLEEYQLDHEQFINFIGFAHSHYLYQHGFLDADKWLRHRGIVERMIENNRHSQIMWESKRDQFTPGFQELVDSFISD
jgi:hypothetical protein